MLIATFVTKIPNKLKVLINYKYLTGLHMLAYTYAYSVLVKPLKMISSVYSQSQEFVYVFCFDSCKASQTVKISQLVIQSKFKVSSTLPLGL